MSIIRTYFDKNNTIISGTKDSVNTGRSPVTELFYGVNTSRFLFYIDFAALRAKIADKSINASSIVRHTLKMKNTSNFDVMPFRDYRDQIQFSDKDHSTSFDLELKPIREYWDEGVGYDFELITNYPDEQVFLNGNSNWNHRTAQHHWSEAGAITSGTTAISTQHFDKGNEDAIMDVTAFVNNLIMTGSTTGTTYGGFCLKYTDYFEKLPEDVRKYTAFFTRSTHTFFEPFIETEYNDLVKDDRRNIILSQPANLVLYALKQGNLFNLDQLPICTINGYVFPVTQISKGVYNATVTLPSNAFSDFVMYHDVWSNIIVDGVAQPSVTQDITPRPSNFVYQFGAGNFDPINYGISVSGIKREEKITQGENRKVLVHLRQPHTVSTVDVADSIFYRMYVKQGINQVSVIDWTEISRSFDSNYFYLDSTWMVPQQYFIDIKVDIRGETRLYNEELRFAVVSVM